MFKAIAALRNDSDYKQWFVNDNYWEFCYYKKFHSFTFINSKKSAKYKDTAKDYHKTTLEELIEHFKNI